MPDVHGPDENRARLEMRQGSQAAVADVVRKNVCPKFMDMMRENRAKVAMKQGPLLVADENVPENTVEEKEAFLLTGATKVVDAKFCNFTDVEESLCIAAVPLSRPRQKMAWGYWK